MDSLLLDIKNIKNIKNCSLDLSFDTGLYAIVGGNGCGKSTLMLLMSLIVKSSSINSLRKYDYQEDSKITININGTIDELFVQNNTWRKTRSANNYYNNHYTGFYEGSIFIGSRFHDYDRIKSYQSKPHTNDIRDADDFVIDTLSLILHGDNNHYKNLKKIKTRDIAKKAGFRGIPYFIEVNKHLISQYNMSSGESMLISLIDFINNITVKNRVPKSEKVVFFIDEAELALHPSAVHRLIDVFEKLIKDEKYNIVVYFSTHSAEIIQRINPKNIYMLENNLGNIEVINPCYPNYAVRNLYIPNGYDFLILVEDELAKIIVETIIRKHNLCESKMWCVIPSGGWSQTLKLHDDIVKRKILGVGKKIISIYDGDVKNEVKKKNEYKSLPKLFIPIKSIEKYLYKNCITEKNKSFIKIIGDKYFNTRSLDDTIKDFMSDPRTKVSKKSNGKNFYDVISSNLLRAGMTEDIFISHLSDDIIAYENFTPFISSLTKLLT